MSTSATSDTTTSDTTAEVTVEAAPGGRTEVTVEAAPGTAPGSPTAGTSAEQGDAVRSRLPDLTHLFPELSKLSGAVRGAVWNGPVAKTTINLMLFRAAQIVGSTYHAVALTDSLRKAGESEKRITAVATWQGAPYFTDAERIALELVEAVLTPNPYGERVSDELFARAAELYDDEELWMLTMAIGHFSLFVPVALIAKPIPGRPIGKNYSEGHRADR
ncbi:carboxymuconolactone decarboxylase family protein [Streptomyces maremycinicus]|uniref:carboxymuconolactone decarboxylase family protein n=1 Tax=Streptomyces maremycinicus TaxID=1679753 RepID=UPI00099E0D10|nr:carboxymuconolactone decarboxylase family protein [Streptomyces sp. NBRC 110468]